jgi:hypothetical protein
MYIFWKKYLPPEYKTRYKKKLENMSYAYEQLKEVVSSRETTSLLSWRGYPFLQIIRTSSLEICQNEKHLSNILSNLI